MSAFRDGMQSVLGLHNYVADGFREGEERKRKNTLAQLAGDYYAAPSQNGLAAIARVDPQAAAQHAGYGQKIEQQHQQEIGQNAAILLTLPKEQQGAFYAAKLQPFLQSKGLEAPPWSEALIPTAQKVAEMWGQQTGVPAEVQAFRLMTAGMSPDDVRKAARVNLGLDGRASSAGIKFGEMMLGDMKTYATRDNPRNGVREVLTDSGWVPADGAVSGGNGAGASAPAGASPAPAGGSAPSGDFAGSVLNIAAKHRFQPTSFGRTPQENASTRGAAKNSAHLSDGAVDFSIRGKSQQEIAAFDAEMKANGWVGGYHANGTAPHLHYQRPRGNAAPTSLPSVASPTPGAVKYDETRGSKSAEVDVQVARAPEVAQAEATVASAREGATQAAKSAAERDSERIAKGKAYQVYQAAMSGLVRGLNNTTTNPVAGRMPAVTAGQQTAEGSIAAMAPVLKQLFRSAGEGVFTDKDQELLIAMLPTRSDHPEARKAKIQNIDAIVAAKLDAVGAPHPTTAAPAGNGWGIKRKGQ